VSLLPSLRERTEVDHEDNWRPFSAWRWHCRNPHRFSQLAIIFLQFAVPSYLRVPFFASSRLKNCTVLRLKNCTVLCCRCYLSGRSEPPLTFTHFFLVYHLCIHVNRQTLPLESCLQPYKLNFCFSLVDLSCVSEILSEHSGG
jgi:hypothetical protein